MSPSLRPAAQELERGLVLIKAYGDHRLIEPQHTINRALFPQSLNTLETCPSSGSGGVISCAVRESRHTTAMHRQSSVGSGACLGLAHSVVLRVLVSEFRGTALNSRVVPHCTELEGPPRPMQAPA